MTRRLLSFFFALSTFGTAIAQENVKSIDVTVERFLAAQTLDLPGTVSIEIGKVADNSRALQCKHWQAFLPTGARIWGRVSVGVRCTEGANLSLFVSASVKVHGKYMVMARAVSGGQVLTVSDIGLAEGELTTLAPDILTRANEAVGQTTRQALSLNQPLRAIYLRGEAAVQAGQTVKVISRGAGFTVANEGKALSTVERGQVVRVRLQNNQIVSGIAREAGIVEVATQ